MSLPENKHLKKIGLAITKKYVWLLLGILIAAELIGIAISAFITSVTTNTFALIISFILNGFVSTFVFMGFFHAINKAFYHHQPTTADLFFPIHKPKMWLRATAVNTIGTAIMLIAVYVFIVVIVLSTLFSVFGGVFVGGVFATGSFTDYSLSVIVIGLTVLVLCILITLCYFSVLGCFTLSVYFSALRNPNILFEQLLEKSLKLTKRLLFRFVKLCLSFTGWFCTCILWSIFVIAMMYESFKQAIYPYTPYFSIAAAPLSIVAIALICIPFLLLLVYFCCTASAFFNTNMDFLEQN
ncbi:MAG: hypothetical protein RRZ73_06010 [Oscillospiraceae bacterium]